MLNCWIWRNIIEHDRNPSTFERTLIAQIQGYMGVHYLRAEYPRRGIRKEAAERVRKEYNAQILAMEKQIQSLGFDHVDVDTLPDDEHDRTCPICKEAFNKPSEDNVLETPVKSHCNHVFGSICLEQWVGDNSTCPLCRVTIHTTAQITAQLKEANERIHESCETEIFIAALQLLTTHDRAKRIATRNNLPPKWLMSILGIQEDRVHLELGFIQAYGLQRFLEMPRPFLGKFPC